MNESISELISAYLYGHITPEQYKQLRDWLAADPQHVREYIREAYLHRAIRLVLQRREVQMRLGAEIEPEHDIIDESADALSTAARTGTEYSGNGRTDPKLEEIRLIADRKLAAFLEEQHRQELMERRKNGLIRNLSEAKDSLLHAFGVLRGVCIRVGRIAAVILIIALIGMALEISLRESGILARLTNPVVATLADSMDAKWSVELENGAPLHKGPLKLLKGYAQLIFQNGTKVWIEAPAEFTLKSAGKMSLQSGRLFANVPESGIGFTVNTPFGRIVDLGTQFGVKVESNRASDLHLFKGRASLTPETGGRTGKSIFLSPDQAKQVTQDGSIRDIPLATTDFVRKINSKTGLAWRGDSINLADILVGGNGFNTGVKAIGIDPGSGSIKTGDLNCTEKDAGKRGYFPVPELDGMDGVFVPDGSQGPVIVSSGGHVFMDCPATAFTHWTPITGQPLVRLNLQDPFSNQFGGPLFSTPDNPAILMHTNSGLTFDLDKIRATLPGFALKQFSATCGIIEGVDWGNKAVFWILVDGEKRGEFHAVGRDPGRYGDLIVPLKEQDRFLTLLTTDGGDDVDHDWTLFGLPYLAVEELP